MTPREKILQSLYLEPHQAKELDKLSEKLKTPKAVLLRGAVDDLLQRHGMSASGPTTGTVQRGLAAARQSLAIYRREIVETNRGIVPLNNVDKALARVDEAIASMKR